ncbi:hypothetical protein B5X24_HaOG209958 [Helicoverpa armigera]|uniref:MICOS complex subunit MIC60 n=1 Tax=Helicoverpa armigera TaxID=29058 RepID=A0A2W1BK06_HELAM|nr:hypothetical protein B5X24_HaOG209958 [Helicoverpa armigera]
MFRVTPCLFTIRTLLYRRHPADFRLASLSQLGPVSRYSSQFKEYKPPGPKERETCPLPKPPPPQPKDDRLFWGTMTLLLLTGGFVIYAKGSPEIRDWLTLNAPWFDDLIAILYQENMTYGEFAVTCIDDTKKLIDRLTGNDKPKKCSLDGGPVLNYDVPEGPKDDDSDVVTCEPEPPPVVTQNICEIERCMHDLGESVINNYLTAREACICYNELVEATMQTFTFKAMKELRYAMEERIELVKTSLNNASGCVSKLEEMVRYLDCGVQATKEQIRNSKLLHRDLQDKFTSAFISYQWENERSLAMDKQWQMVEVAVEKYTSENVAMFPELDYAAKKPTIDGDVDILLYNSYRYVHQLNGHLKEASDGMSDRISRTLATLSHGGDAEKANEAYLQTVVKTKKEDLMKEFKQREDDQKLKNENNLKACLQKQNEQHEANLATKLEEMEAEVTEKFNRMVREKVADEKRLFAEELADMASKLKIVEDKLEARMKAEKESRRSQELWAAGESLLAATKRGDPIVKVEKEIKAIEKASGGDDKLVKIVLKSIPSSVYKTGIVPESVLRDGFRVMEKTARNVALVEQDGAAMPVYMLSWLQGLFLFMQVSSIPQAEFEKPDQDPPIGLDTFDLLQRARFWLDRGNLAAAVRYVDNLQGASKAAAAKWFEAARAHLEVRQAAEAVLAHAAAMGLQYI